MSMERTFTSRVSRRADDQRKQQKVRLTLNTEDDETQEVTFSEAYTFTRPSEGRLFLMATAFGASSRPENAASEVDAALRDMLLDEAPPLQPGGRPRSEYLMLRDRISGPVEKRIELEDMMDILGALVGEWSDDFPTQPSSDSSPEQPTIGGRSTGRVHSPVSIPSSSPSDGF